MDFQVKVTFSVDEFNPDDSVICYQSWVYAVDDKRETPRFLVYNTVKPGFQWVSVCCCCPLNIPVENKENTEKEVKKTRKKIK